MDNQKYANKVVSYMRWKEYKFRSGDVRARIQQQLRKAQLDVWLEMEQLFSKYLKGEFEFEELRERTNELARRIGYDEEQTNDNQS